MAVKRGAARAAAAPKAAPKKAAVTPAGKASGAATKKAAKLTAAAPRPIALPTTPGFVFTAGANMAGELGVSSDDYPERAKLGAVKSLDDKEVVDVVCGGMHAVAITAKRQLITWGNNDERALGRASTDPLPAPAENLDGVVVIQVACCDNATFALADDGRLFGCGTFRDMDGVIGFQPGQRHQELFGPVSSVAHLRFSRIAAGVNHVVALTVDGKVMTFGSGRRQVANPNLDVFKPAELLQRSLIDEAPSPLGRTARGRHRQRDDTLQAQGIGHFATRASGPVVDVFAGSYNGFALTENHYVFAWGLNKNGQLGLGDEEDRDRPTEVPALRGLKVVAIAGGDFHTLVLTATGELYGMGKALGGALGLSESVTDNQLVPVRIPIEGGAKVARIACGSSHSMVITEDGRLFTFGNNNVRQLGLGDDADDDVYEPTHVVTANRKVLAVAGGGQFTVAVATARQEPPK